MSDLISRDELRENMLYAMCGTGYQSVALTEIDRMPSVDAVPVRHGRWVERWVDNKHRIGDMECSVCGAPMLDCPSYSLYCPWCGARMDKNETD